MYAPRVLGVRAGQPLAFANSDPLLHNVHAVAEEQSGFNLAMPMRSPQQARVFDAPEVMVRVKCDVHPWMAAYVGVVAHPYFAVTPADGTFAFAGLPPGDYTVEVWHETLGRASGRVTLPPAGDVTAGLALPTLPSP
jgi:hypothetical protein